MNRGRPRLEPLLAERVNERLHDLLTGTPPRRAEPGPEPRAARLSDPTRSKLERLSTDPSRVVGGPLAGDDPDDEDETDVGDGGRPPGSAASLPPVRRFTGLHVRVVGVLVVAALIATGWSLLRAKPVALAQPAAVTTTVPGPVAPASPPPGSPAAPSTGGPSSTETVVVHVLGAVHKPGLVRLPLRSRVQDAVEAAGGLTRSADPDELNLAQILSDGEQIVIGERGKPAGEVRNGAGGTVGGSAGGSTTGAVLDLNQATQTQLEGLPGVGPVTAGKILGWRTEHRRFSAVAELQEVDGIGPKTFAQIAPHVRV